MNILSTKLKEVLSSVIPIVLIVLILHFTGLVPLSSPVLIRFLIGSALIIIGLAIFLMGVDLSITRIGTSIGNFIIKKNKILVVIFVGLLLGLVINFSEPVLHILGGQVESATGGQFTKLALVIIVSTGVGVLVSLGLVRIVRNFALNKILIVVYGIIGIFAIFAEDIFIGIAFDSAGATTGAVIIPFLLALAAGMSALKKDSKASEVDSFGLVGLAATGAIVAVIVASVIGNITIDTTMAQNGEAAIGEISTSAIQPFLEDTPNVLRDVAFVILPVLLIYSIFQWLFLKLPKRSTRRILFGLLFSFIGLIFFMLGVRVGFMEVGEQVGIILAGYENHLPIIIVAFLLGLVTVLAEPAVSVLTHQVENVTSGHIKRRVVSAALSLGVGLAVMLTIVKILIPGLQLWHFLLPGYIIALGLTFFVPPLFVGIAFDAGAVATGPITSTFIFAFAKGAASEASGMNALVDGFGLIAMVAMTPVIALQILGLIYSVKNKKEQVSEE